MKTSTQSIVIENHHSAIEMGSGTLKVFATPAMIAFMENTAMKTIDNLPQGHTTVGVEINVNHIKASKIGEMVKCAATLIHHEGRIYEFNIVVTNANGDIIGTATHKRALVETEKFLQKINSIG